MIGQKYIDLELVRQLLDHLGVHVVENESVSEAVEAGRRITFGVHAPWAIEARAESRKGDRTEREFEIPNARPTKLAALALQGCRHDRSLIDLDSEPDAAVTARSPILFTSELDKAASAEIAEALGSVLSMADAKLFEEPLEGAAEARWLLGSGQASRIQPLIGELPDGRTVVVLARDKSILPDYDDEDLLDDRQCFGVVERVLSKDQSIDLTRHLFSGLNRTIRRSIHSQLLDAISDIDGLTISPTGLEIPGPAIVVRAAVIA